MIPVLTLTVFLPLFGALPLLAWRRAPAAGVHALGLASSALALAGTIWIALRGVHGGGFSQVEQAGWIPALRASYLVGVDGISIFVVLLSALLFFLAFVYTSTLRREPRAFVALMLLLETACLGAFLALDALLFYVFFELSLVSMYFLIAHWGHERRQRAALMFFLYTLLGSLPLLLAILGMYLGSDPSTFDMRAWIAHPPLTGTAATLALIGMLITFAVKTPVVPLHTWLPAAHVEAPTAGSVILAGVMLKLGAYGLVRFALQLTPGAFHRAAVAVIVVGVASALFGAFAALAQTDLKRLVAYTSINHMGYVVVGVAVAALTLDPGARALALDGAVLQMVSHGLVTGALFFLVGSLAERTGTREQGRLGGLLTIAPALGWGFVMAAFASLGLPGLAHFPAEFQIFLATLRASPAALVVLLGIAVTAGLYLRAIARVFLGETPARWRDLRDLGVRELLTVLPLLALTLAVGVAPAWLLATIHATTSTLGPG